jgi:hypothetical protein
MAPGSDRTFGGRRCASLLMVRRRARSRSVRITRVSVGGTSSSICAIEATVAQWYKEHGRHEVFTRGKEVELGDKSHNLILNEVDLARPNKPEMDGPKTAAEEMQMMRKLYQQMVMEKAQIKAEPMIQIGGLNKKDKELAVAE